MADKIILRKDTQANWVLKNPILLDGEQGYETDTKKIKVGDGVSTWNLLGYFGVDDDKTEVISFTLADIGANTFEVATNEMVATYIASLGLQEDLVTDYIYELTENPPPPVKYFPLPNLVINPIVGNTGNDNQVFNGQSYTFVPNDGLYFDEAPTDFSDMFNSYNNRFNEDISDWDVGAITNMENMFKFTKFFNQDIGGWNVSSVINMSGMFTSTKAFNQDISGWDVGNVTYMNAMFSYSEVFNQPIGAWDMSSVIQIEEMFRASKAFNQDLSGWDVSNVINFRKVFEWADVFNQDISSWDVSSGVTYRSMFAYTKAFNQDLSQWCVSSVNEMVFNFSDYAPQYTLPKPVWGTCPRGENQL